MKKKIFGSLAVVALLGAFFLVGPKQLGGSVSYVVTSGSSMEPGMSDGDLVIVREASSYEVGDAVAYMNEELGSPVLHRIVRKEGNRYVFQGDNNDFLDTYEPTDDKILGSSWVVIPGGGKLLRSLASPAVAASIAVLLGLSISGSVVLRRRHRSPDAPPPTVGVSTGIVPPTDIFRRIAPAIAIGLALFLLLGVLAFKRSTTVGSENVVAFEHTGRFTYTGEATGSQGVYDSGNVTTGDPIYRSLVSDLVFRFDYALEGDVADGNAPSASGELGMNVRLSSPDGWKRDLPLAQTETIEGPTGTIEGALDLAQVNRMIEKVESETGFDPGLYNLEVIATASVVGEVAGQAIDETFEPKLGFTLDQTKLQLVQSTVDADVASSLNPVEAGSVTATEIEPSYLSLLGLDVPIADARMIALGGIALLLLLGGAVGWGYHRARALESDAVRILARYLDRFVAVRSMESLNGLPAVEMASIEELVRIADAHQSLLLYVPVEPIDLFVLEQGGVVYYYTLERKSLNDDLHDSTVVEEVREILLDKMPPPPPESLWLNGKIDVG